MRLQMTIALAAIVGSGAFADPPKFNTEEARIEIAKADVKNLTKAVEAFKMRQGVFPVKLKDLQDAGLVEPGKPLKDPWGSDYEYDPKGPKNGGKKPDIWCNAPEKKKIGNWPAEKQGP
jgi:hypothetical protein